MSVFGPLDDKQLPLNTNEHVLRKAKANVEGVKATLALTDQRIIVAGRRGALGLKADVLFDIDLRDIDQAEGAGHIRKSLEIEYDDVAGQKNHLSLGSIGNPDHWALVMKKACEARRDEDAPADEAKD